MVGIGSVSLAVNTARLVNQCDFLQILAGPSTRCKKQKRYCSFDAVVLAWVYFGSSLLQQLRSL